MRHHRRFKPYRDRPLCFLDIETTGTKPGYHEVTEIGFRHTEKGGLCIQIAPRHMERAEPEALKISGYNTSDWVDAKPFRMSAPRITEFLRDATLIGHNIIKFDIPMLSGEYESNQLDSDGLFRDAIDTMVLARTFLVPLGLNMLNLGACMKFIGESYDGAHTAFEDAGFAQKLYLHITKNLKWHGKQNGKRIQEDLFGDKP
jgi:DNA polymerase-3 subunit epsilon